MRRLCVSIVALITLLAAVAPAQGAPAITPQEWQWIVQLQEKESQGETAGVIELERQLVDSLKTHNFDACGNHAQNLGRLLDKAERYTEAVAAFEDEFACWGQFDDRAEWVLWDQRRAEQIRPEIQAFVARPTAGEPAAQLARHEPVFGTMLGGVIDNDTAVNNDLGRVAATYGKSYAMVLVYVEWGGALPVVSTREARQAGAALQVALNPGLGLDAVRDDAYLRDFAQKLNEYGYPVFLRFGGEMNGAWTPWHQTPAQFRAKFALVARIMRQIAPNVAMVWSPNYVGDLPYRDYYPGDEWVDWVGINLYHEPYFLGDPGTRPMDEDIFWQGKRTNPLDKVKPIYQEYASRKPIMISETGFGWASRTVYREEVAWAADTLRRFYGYAPLLYPRLKAISYFNVDVNAHPSIPSSSHYVLSGKPAMTEAYRQATANGWYLASPTASSPSFWRPMDRATLTGKTQVASYVNLGGGVSRVEYVLDGRTVATAHALPWEADLDFSGLTGEHTVTVRAYDLKGRLGHEREYRFDGSATKIQLNGRYLDFDHPPVNVDGRLMVPARAILEAMGAEVIWDAGARTVIARKDGSELRLIIGDPVPTRDGQALAALDVPAQIIGGRTLIPARFAAEYFNMDVNWDSATSTMVITPKRP